MVGQRWLSRRYFVLIESAWQKGRKTQENAKWSHTKVDPGSTFAKSQSNIIQQSTALANLQAHIPGRILSSMYRALCNTGALAFFFLDSSGIWTGPGYQCLEKLKDYIIPLLSIKHCSMVSFNIDSQKRSKVLSSTIVDVKSKKCNTYWLDE